MDEKALKKADAELTKAAQKSMDLIYYATCLALYRHFGWKELRISRFMDKSQEVYRDCASNVDLSMIQMCDIEVGIEFRSLKNESYKDTPYLCNEKWNNIRPEWIKKPKDYQLAWLIRMKQKMRDWMSPQIMASVALALHRKEGWGMQRISALTQYVDNICAEFGEDIKAMCKAVEQETGMRYTHTTSGELALLQKG